MSKSKWNCESIQFIEQEINIRELKQRLAEVLLLLLNTKSQLNSNLAFSKINSRRTAPLVNKQRSA